MPRIICDDQDFQELLWRVQRMSENIQVVIHHLNAAVYGNDWKSRAATSYRDLWAEQIPTLNQLAEIFRDWQQALNDQAYFPVNLSHPRI